jgi:hypothetical protein
LSLSEIWRWPASSRTSCGVSKCLKCKNTLV